jgi:hypothetical protein
MYNFSTSVYSAGLLINPREFPGISFDCPFKTAVIDEEKTSGGIMHAKTKYLWTSDWPLVDM